MATKTKLFIPSHNSLRVGFLLLTFGFVFLFTQNSFAAYTKWGNSTENEFIEVGIDDGGPGYKHCATPSSASTAVGGMHWENYESNEFCLLDQSIINKKLSQTNDYGHNVIGLTITDIKVPYSIAENLWKTIDTTGPSYPGDLHKCQQTKINQCSEETWISYSSLSTTFTIPQIYDNVKTEIIRSCLPGKINSIIRPEATSLCCEINRHKPPRDIYATNYPSDYAPWTFSGCDPLSSSMSMIINRKPASEDGGVAIRLGSGQALNLSWSLSNPSASCELRGFDATDADSKEKIITKIAPTDVEINVRAVSGQPVVNKPATGQTTYDNTKMGIFTYTFSCAGTLDGKNFPPSETDEPVVIKKKVLVGRIPDQPTISSFTIKKLDGTAFPNTEIQDPQYPNDPTKKISVPQIHLTDEFKLCWVAQSANPSIILTPLRGLAQLGVTRIQPTTQYPNILNACIEKKLPPADLPIGPWNYELEVEDSLWTKKGLGSDIKNITIDVVPIEPVIEIFEVLAKDESPAKDRNGNWIATTSVPTNAKIRLHWKVINTNNVSIEGSNFTDSKPAISGADDYSSVPGKNWLDVDESDQAPSYTYTLKAHDLVYQTTIDRTITVQRRQPGAPTIKFEFDKSSVTKKEGGGSGYATLKWVTEGARLINIEGTGVPFSATAYPSTGSIKISIDDLSVAPEGLEYSITACPTSAYNVNCSTLKTTLKVYSSDTFGANLFVDDAIIRTGDSTMLRWEVASNDKIESYSIVSSSGDINLTEVPSADGYLRLSGEREITPSTKTTYTLNIQSFDTSLMPDFSTSVTVGTTDKDSPAVEFSADKTEINKGEAVVLTWNAQDAKEVSINNNIGSVAKQGTTTVYPDFTTLYILTAKSTQPGVIPDSEKTVRIKIRSVGFEGLKEADKWTDPTRLKTRYGLINQAEIDAATKAGILDLKVNGLDGPITVKSPANIVLSWNLNKYCLATGSWLSIKTKAGTENITLKKNGKYTYSLYCPGTGSDSVEVTVTGGLGGLLDNLLGRNGDGTGTGEDSEGLMPIAEVAVSTDKIVFSTDVRVVKGEEVELFIRADKDISGDGKASRDQNGEWGALLSNGGGCLYNTKLTKDLQFDGGVQDPKSPADCNASLGKFTFNDEPGTYQYGVFKLVQNDGKFSNIAYITVTVDGPPAINSAPTIDFRINNKDDSEQTLGTPANYYLTWDVANANSCLATGSWNGMKPVKGIRNFLRSSKSDVVYTLTCENELGITAKTIALKIVESPTCAFTAMPPVLNKQSSFVTESELYWKCTYTDECNLSPNKAGGQIKAYGNMRVSPDQSTTYTLTCTNSDISKSFEARVEVK